MDYDEFEFLFEPFADGEPDMGVEGVQDIACPFKLEDDVYDALGLQGLSFCHDHYGAAAATPHPFESLPPLDDAESFVKSQKFDSGLFGSPEDSSWAIEKLDFSDILFTAAAATAITPESVPSPTPSSPDVSSSPPSSIDDFVCSPDSSPRSPAWTYDSFSDGVSYDEKLGETLQVALDGISQGVRPTKDQVLAFVLPGRKGGFVCAVDSCEWHTKGWKREDRGISHVLKEHFRVLNFPCEDCRIYKWPHDLTKHRLLKHSNPGDKPPTQYICPESLCGQTFDKSYNLARHRRNVHRKSGRTSKAKTRREH